MGARGRNRLGEHYETLSDERKKKSSRLKGCMQGLAARLCRPLRIFQFLSTLLLFAMAVYMTAIPYRILTDLGSILLIVLTATYLFFMAIDIISQFEAKELTDTPMFLFSLFGMLFFATAGALLIHFTQERNVWPLVVAKVLCFIISILFLMEVAMLLTSWRQRCVSWTKCYPYPPGGDFGRLMFHPGDDGRGLDIEGGCVDETTSVSNYGAQMDDTDTAVSQHGCRRISVGHRRQYIDRESSVPMISETHFAEIQTDRGSTVITECQTQRTETRESVIQTNSRCELCNRQMDDLSASPRKSSTPPPSPLVDSQSQYSPSPRRSSIPVADSAILPTEKIHSNAPSIVTSDPRPEQGSCAICPAFLQMMRAGMGGPCCQSCKCGGVDHRPSWVSEHWNQSHGPEIPSPRWSQKEPQRTTRLLSTAKSLGSASPSTNNEKSDGERSDLVIEEVNRRRPSKKMSTVYETRPSLAHGSSLAARTEGLPETVTRLPLSSNYMRRNKRTQTPKRESLVSEESGNTRVREDTRTERHTEVRIVDCPGTSGPRKTLEEARDRSQSENTNESRMSEERVKLRISSCVTPRKLYRNSESISQWKSTMPSIDSPHDNVSKTKESMMILRDTSWKSEKTEIEGSVVGAGAEDPSTTNVESPSKKNTIETTSIETPRLSPKLQRTYDTGESVVESIKGSENKLAESSSLTDPGGSAPVSGPVLRLRLEKSFDQTTSSDPKTDGVASPRGSISRSRTTLRSRSRGLPSITGSGALSKSHDEVTNHRTGGRQESVTDPRSADLKESSVSRQTSARSRADGLADLTSQEKLPIDDRDATARSHDTDRSGHEFSGYGNQETLEKSETSSTHRDYTSPNRTTRTKTMQKDVIF